MKKFLWVSFFLFLGGFAFAAEKESPIWVKAEVNRAFITIGDEIQFKLSVTHQPDITVLDMAASDALKDFKVKTEKSFSFKEKGLVTEGKNFSITSYELGEYVIRPIEITYRDGQGSASKLKSASLYISVESVDKNKDPNSDIRGIKGVVDIKAVIWPWILSAGLAAAAVLGFVLWRRWREKKIFQPKSAEKLLSPHDEAYRALIQLGHSDLLQKSDFKTYFFRLSEILRRYFERRFQMNALELTTTEVLQDLKSKLGSSDLTLSREVLSFCDLVKFAKLIPSPQEILLLNQNTKKIIDDTKQEEQSLPSSDSLPEKPEKG